MKIVHFIIYYYISLTVFEKTVFIWIFAIVFLRWRSRVKIGRKYIWKKEKGADMGYFYFTRHGQTVWNVENKICGVTDIERSLPIELCGRESILTKSSVLR